MKKIAAILFATMLVGLVSSTVSASAPPNDEIRPPMCKPHWAKCKWNDECCSKSCSGTCNA
jgi:hypothetical protein